MRNKFSSNLLKKGLISFAAASVLATGAMAAGTADNSTTKDFKLFVDKTTVDKSQCAYVTVALINESGEIDTANGGNVNSIPFNVTSILGTLYQDFNTTTTFSSSNLDPKAGSSYFTNGVAKFSVCYTDKIGDDTLTISSYIKGIVTTDVTDLGVSTVDVKVKEADNQANFLAISKISPINATTVGNSEGTYYIDSTSDVNATLLAGESFVVAVDAYSLSSSETLNQAKEKNQNGTITLEFYKDGMASKGVAEATITGEMLNGFASITVPSGTLSTADDYYVIAKVPTSVATTNLDYIASNLSDGNTSITNSLSVEKLTISAKGTSSLGFLVNGSASTTEFNMLADSSTASNIQKVELCALDEYGNLADSSTISTAISFDLASTQKILSQSTSLLNQTISASTNCKDISSFLRVHTDVVTGLSTTTMSSTDTITATSSGLNTATVNANIYKYALILSGEENLSMGIGNSFKSGSYNAGNNLIENNLSALITTTVAGYKMWADGNVSTGDNTTDINTSSKLWGSSNKINLSTYLLTSDNNVSKWESDVYETISNLTAEDGDVNSTKVRFQKAGNVGFYATMSVDDTNTTAKAYNIMPYSSKDTSLYLSRTVSTYNTAYADDSHNDLNVSIGSYYDSTNSVFSAQDGSFGIVKYTPSNAYTGAPAVEAEVDSISLDLNTSSPLATGAKLQLGTYLDKTNFIGSSSDVNKSTDGNFYLIKLKDAYGNPSDATSAFKVISTDGGIQPSDINETGSYTSSKYIQLTNGGDINSSYGYKVAGTDSLKLTSTVFGVADKTIDITTVDKSTSLTELTLTSNADTLLTNTSTVVTVNAVKDNGKAYDFSVATNGLTVTISNPNMLTLTNSGGVQIQNGDSIVDNTTDLISTSGTFGFILKSANTVGDVTVNVKNTAGTVVGSKVFSVIKSTADLPSPISSIDVSEGNSVYLTSGTTGSYTVKVTKENGDAEVNANISVTSDNTNVVTVPSEITTDENGEATLSITSSSVVSTANVELSIGGKSTVINVSVQASPTMTLASTEASVAMNAQTSVAVSNNEGTPTITTSDDTIVTASYSGGSIVINGVSDGTATITVTDTDGTVQTIAVTVQAAVVPTDLTDTTKVTDTAGVINEDGQIIMSGAEAVISLLNAFNSSDATLAANTTVAGLEATTLGTTTFFKENGKSIFAINYSTSGGATTITISWLDTARALRAVEPDYVVTITDGDQTMELPIVKAISVATESATTPALVEGWNLLGNASNNTQTVSNANIGLTWTFDGVWTQDAPVPAGQGFWAKATAAQAGLEFANDGDGTGAPTFTAGEWSLMSSTTAQTLADVLTANDGATIAWTFIDSVWSNATEAGDTAVEAGRGYWVK